MQISTLLSDPAKFEDQLVELEGALYIADVFTKEWRFFDNTITDELAPFLTIRCVNNDDPFSPQGRSDLANVLSLRLNWDDPHKTMVLDNITIIGKLTFENGQAFLVSENIEKIVRPIPYHNITVHIKNDIQFSEVDLKINTITPLLALRDNFELYRDRFVRVEGIIRGLTRPEEISWIASLENGDAFKREPHQTQCALLLNKKGLLDDIIHGREGGEFAYFDDVQAIGRIDKTDNSSFAATLKDMSHLLIKSDGKRRITVFEFDS